MATIPRSKSPRRAGARGFPLRLPVRYCLGGETRWLSGRTECISEAETLVRAPRPAANGPVRFIISLPSAGAEPGGCLVGSGSIARAPQQHAATPRDVFAIAVTECHLERADQASPNRSR